jgi:formamidopyrimidine-DNA glycosylase
MQNFIQDKKLGIDPYDDNFDLRKFKSLADSSRGTVKSFLMNQKIIAGIGNIYSDEILFSTGIHPDSKLNKLQESDLKDIFRALKKVLDTAIEKKVNVSDFPSHYLLPNREEGKGCPKCSGKIKKAVIAGRSSYFCSKHQKLKE